MARDYYNEKKKRNEYTPTQSGAKQGADSSTRSQSSSTKKEKILKNLGINNNSKGGSNNNAGSYYGGGYRRNTQTQKQKEVQGPQQKQTTQQRRLQNYERRTQRPRVASTSKEMMQQRDLQNQIRNKANERTKAYQEELNSRRPVPGQIKDNKRISPDITAKQREIQQRANQQTQNYEAEREATKQKDAKVRKRALSNTPKIIEKAGKDVATGYAKTFLDVTEMTASNPNVTHAQAMKMGLDPEKDKDTIAQIERNRKESAKRDREARLRLHGQQMKRQEEWDELSKDAKGLEKAYYGALESGVGMAADIAVGAATGTGQFGALASMGIRTYGTTRGTAEPEGATESEDRLYSLLNAGKEVGTEAMFHGAGLAKKAYSGGKIGLGFGEKAAYALTKGLTGTKGSVAHSALNIALGTGEENLEELAAWGLEPLIKEVTYGKNVRERYKASLLNGAPEITSQAQADRVAAYFSSSDFEDELVKDLRASGVSKKKAEEIAEKYKEFYVAHYSGDTETEDRLAGELSGLEKLSKDSWSHEELMDTFAATTLLTATTGGAGAVYTSVKGNKIFDSPEVRERFGDDAERLVAEVVKNTDNKALSVSAKAMEDRLKSGGELTGTMKYQLWNGYLKKQNDTAKKIKASNDTASKTMQDEKLESPVIGYTKSGQAVFNQETQRIYDEKIASASVTAEALRRFSKNSISDDEIKRTDAAIKAVSDLHVGALTVGDSFEFAYGNTLARETLKAEEGIDLDDYIVRDENGDVDLAATNKATEDALFKLNTQNAIETARAETEAFIDNARGEIDTDLMERFGSNGQAVWKEINKDLDPRELNRYLASAQVASFFYAAGRSTEMSVDEAIREYGSAYKSVDESIMKRAFAAGARDRIIEYTPGHGQTVKAGDKIALKKTKAVKSGELFIEVEEGVVVPDEMQGMCKSLAESTNFNIHLVSDLSPVDENGNPRLDKNGNPVQINGMKKGNDIYLNVNASVEQNLGYVFMHEMTHLIKQFAPNEYMALENLVREKWFEKDYEGMQREIRRTLDLYSNVGKQNLTEAEAMEEIVCNAMAEAIDDPSFAAEVCEQDLNLGQQILNSIKEALRSIRNMFVSNKFKNERFHNSLLSYLDILNQAEEMWINALAVARQNRADGLIADWQTKANKSQRLSVNDNTDSRFSITPEQDDKYMRAAKRGDMRTTQQMVDDVAEANGYVKSVYHGTGEYFNVFNLGREGIHLGNKEQASEVSRSRYMLRSKNTNYSTEDVLNNLDKMSPEAIEKVLETVDYALLMLRNSNIEQYRGDHSDIESIRAYAKEVTDAYKQEQGKDLGFRLPTFDRKVGENMLRLYAKLNNPFVIEDDIGDWTPARIADVLLLRAEGATEMDGGIERNGTTMLNISGSEISLGRETRKALEKISKYEVKDDEAWRLLRGVLEQKGYDGIQYLNTYEGDRNSYSYIALNPRDVKLADPITYDDNGEIIPLSERFDTTSPDMRYSITPEQDAEYMAKVEEYQRLYDSNEWGWIQAEQELQKMVDKAAIENGYNIKAYHGTDAEPFNVFDRNKLRHGRQYGDGFYFSPYEEVAGQYGSDVREYYLKANGMTLHELFDRPAATGYRDFDNREEALEFSREKRKQFEENGQGIERFRPESRMVDGKYRVTYTTIGSFQNNLILVATDPEYIKSADPITYDDNGNVIPLSERFDATSPDMRYSISEVDSEGNALSEGQREFFKDSKVVDEDGNLLRLYHGTPDYGFTVFDGNGFRNHDGWFFTSSQKAAESYAYGDESGVYAVYLNLKNPMIIDAEGQDWTSISTYKSIEARNRAKEIDARLDEIRDAWVNKTDNGEYNRLLEEFEELDEQMSGGDTDSWVATAKEEGHDGLIILNILDYGANYEGGELVEFTEVIAFERNQIKNIDNLNPTEDEDIRYSVSPEMQQKVEREVGPDIKFSINGSFRDANAKAKFIASLNSGKGGFAGLSEIASGKTILERTMLKNGFDIKQTNAVVGFLEHMAKYLEDENLHLKYRFIGWDDLTDAKVSVRRDSDGNIVSVAVSAMVVNGEYPVNFDMTTICNKREGVMEVIQALTQKYDADTGKTILNSIKLTDEKMWSINKALKAEGIDTACLGCFVEARRYYTNRFIDKIDEVWNSAVRDARKKLGLPEEEYFNFAKGKKVSGEDYNQVADLWTAYDESTESKRSPAQRIKILMDEIVKNKEVDSPYLKLISAEDILTPEGIRGFKELSTHRKDRDMVKMIKSIYGTSAPKEILAFTPYNSEIALLPEKIKGIDTADYLKSIGGTRVQSFSDFKMEHFFDHMQMVAEEAARGFVNHGYSKVIAYPRLFGLTGRKINMSVMFDVLPASEWQNVLGCDPIKAVEIAKKYQGLRFVKEKPSKVVDNRPYKEATIEGVHGYLTYLVSDADYVNSVFDRLYDENIKAGMSPEEARRKANTDKPFEQSINYREAVELQNKEGYKENIGIIAVAFGDEHLKMLLDDPNVRYIIPYHRSGLPVFIAQKTALDIARDYTDFQNTNKAKRGLWISPDGQSRRMKSMYEEFVSNNPSLEYPAIEFFAKEINGKGYTVEFGKKTTMEKGALAGTASFDVYENLETAKDIREISNAYLEYCINHNYVPVFHEFAGHPNYYKMLFDFAVTDGTTDHIYPQRAVKNVYPGLNLEDIVASGRSIEDLTEDDFAEFYEQIEKGFAEQNAKTEIRRNRLGKVLDEDLLSITGENSIVADSNIQHIVNGTPDYTSVRYGNEEVTPEESPEDIKHSISANYDDAYMDAVNSGDMETAQRLVDEAAHIAGMRVVHRYHGSMNANFTRFDKAYAKVGGNSGAGFYFSTSRQDSADHYEDVEGADNYFKWSALAEQIHDAVSEGTWEGYPELGIEADDIETYEDAEEAAKKILNRSPGVYDVYLNYKNPYVRDYNRSTDLFDYIMDGFDESIIDRDDYDSEDDYEDALIEYRDEYFFDRIYKAVYAAYDQIEGFYDYVDLPNAYDLASTISGLYDYNLNWESIEREIYELHEVVLSRDDWDGSGDGTRELTRAIIEQLGFDAIEDKEVSSKFGQLSREMATDTEHIIVFKPEQIKLSDPVTYREDGSVIPLSERFDPNNNDIRYSLPTQDSDGKVLTDGQMEYFKNSQARRENGKLIRFYHFTDNGRFTVFDPSYSADHRSFFFTDDRSVGQTYSFEDEPIEFSSEELSNNNEEDTAGYYSVYLNLVNPLVIDADMSAWNMVLPKGYERTRIEMSEWHGKWDVDYNIAERGPSYDVEWGNSESERFESKEEAETFVVEKFGQAMLDYLADNDYYFDDIYSVENQEIMPVPTSLPGIDTGETSESTRQIAQRAYDNGHDGVIFKNLVDIGGKQDSPMAWESTIAVVFSPTQIKAIDNENPTDDPDIRFSIADDESTMNYMQSKAKTTDDLWSNDPVIAEGRVRYSMSKKDFVNASKKMFDDKWQRESRPETLDISEGNIRKVIMAAMESSDTNARYRQNTVRNTIKRAKIAYNYLHNNDPAKAAEVIFDHSMYVVENLEFFVEDENFERWKGLKKYLRNHKMTVDVEDREPGYPLFRQNNFGKILLVNEGGINPTEAWEELNKIWPDVFTKDIKSDPNAILKQAEYALEILKPLAQAYTSEECMNLASSIAQDILDIIYEGDNWHIDENSYEEKTASMKERHGEATRVVQKSIHNMRKQYTGKIKSIKEKNKRKDTKKKEAKIHRALYDSILKEYNDLTKRLLNPTKDRAKNIPEQLHQPLAEMLACFDLEKETSKKLEAKYMIPTRKQLNFRLLKDALKKVAEENPTAYEYSDLHHYLENKMTEIADRVDGKTIDYLELSDLHTIEDLMRGLNAAIKNGQQLAIDSEKYQAQQICDKVGEGTKEYEAVWGKAKQYGGIRQFVDNIVNMGELTPIYFFRQIKGMYDMYRQLRKGFDEYVRNDKVIIDKIADILAPYYKTNKKGQRIKGSDIEKWRHAESAEVCDLTYGSIRLTVAQKMSLYCLAKREQAKGHMLSDNGGVVASEITAGSKMLKAEEAWKGKEFQVEQLPLTPADIDEIISTLTEDQKHIADELQRLMSKDMSELGNKASMALLDIEMYKEDNYFPIKIQGESIGKNLDNLGMKEKVRNPGFSNPLKEGASNPIILDDIFAVTAKHCNEMNLYASYAVPLTNFMKVYNGSVFNEETGKAVKIQTIIKQTYGEKAIQYIDNFLDDINGNSFKRHGGLDSVLDQALGQAKKAAVFANLRVALQQPTAIIRACAVMKAKYFTGVKPSTKETEEMFEHCPIAQWKSWGYYDTHFGRDIEDVMMGVNVSSRVSIIMSDIYGALDNMTWGMIWQAVKNEVRAEHKGIDETSQEWWDLCNERASFVFDSTQVVDSPFHRSNDMRSKDSFVKQLTSFQAEPTLSFNVLRQGIVDTIEEGKKGNKKKAEENLRRVILVWTAQAVAVAFAQSVVDALRRKGHQKKDDDEDEALTLYQEILKYFNRNFKKNFLDDINPINNIYWFKEFIPGIVNALTGEYVFGTQNLAFQWYDSITSGIQKCKKKWEKGEESNDTWYDCLTELFGGFGYIAGVPLKTMMRGTKNFFHWIGKAFGISVFADDGSIDKAVDEFVDKFRRDKDEEDSDSKSKKKKKSSGDSDSEEESEPVVRDETEMADARSEKAEQIAEKYGDLSGSEKDKKVWNSVTTFAKDQTGAKGFKEIIADGDYASIAQYRDMYIEAGGSASYFDERVMDMTKTEFKKSLKYDQNVGERSNMKAMWRYMVKNGYTEEEISADILYKSDLAKDLKVAFRMGDEGIINEALVPLVDAGIVFNDIQKLWDNRNHMQLSSYDGRFKDLLKSTGNFIWPVNGTITSHFGARNAPTRGASSNHPAIDIAAPTGTPVSAADGGVVIYAGSNGGYGNSVGIKHDNGMVTYYNHLSGWNVKKGDTVAQGQQIGAVGSTGISTGPHLDFKVLDTNGKPVDPEKYLSKLG